MKSMPTIKHFLMKLLAQLKTHVRLLTMLVGILFASGISASQVNEQRIVQANSDAEKGNWLTHGRTYAEERYSPLKQIDVNSISKLSLAWYYDIPTKRGLEASPIVDNGVMYSTGAWSIVYANDALTGKLLWQYDPKVDRSIAVVGCCDAVNRGVAVWEDKVIFGSYDGRLIALDANSGEPVWETLTIDKDKPYTITGAPRIIKGKVIIGNGGAEMGVRGYFSAYDANTGEMLWRFYTVPGDPAKPFESKALEDAAATWKGSRWWEIGGGGTVWDSMAYDPELDLLYVGVGNGSPWNRFIRSPGGGDNLYLSSILAVKPDTGEYVWHYQTTPGDSWDYTATQHIILTDLEIDGRTRKVLLQAPKNGFFYVLDRVTGELISAEPYVKINWATHVDMATGRPVETAEQYENEMKITFPSPYGGHNWHPMSFNPDTGLVYIPAMDAPFFYGSSQDYKVNPHGWNTGLDLQVGAPALEDDIVLNRALAKSLIKGALIAWDPVAKKERWRVNHDIMWNGGTLTTAGNLVFQGTATGKFNAYQADSGKALWSFESQTGIIAPPISYEINGDQYITIQAGWGGGFALASGEAAALANVENISRILTFKLNGGAKLPAYERPKKALPALQPLTASQEQVQVGWSKFHEYCSVCHGPGVVGGGVVPDLRYLTPEKHQIWDAIVRGGVLRDKGMVSFASVLTPEESKAIQAYVIDRSHHLKNALDEAENNSMWYRVKKFYLETKASLLAKLVSM